MKFFCFFLEYCLYVSFHSFWTGEGQEVYVAFGQSEVTWHRSWFYEQEMCICPFQWYRTKVDHFRWPRIQVLLFHQSINPFYNCPHFILCFSNSFCYNFQHSPFIFWWPVWYVHLHKCHSLTAENKLCSFGWVTICSLVGVSGLAVRMLKRQKLSSNTKRVFF